MANGWLIFLNQQFNMKTKQLLEKLEDYDISPKVKNVMHVIIRDCFDDFNDRRFGKFLEQFFWGIKEVYKDDAVEITRFMTDGAPRKKGSGQIKPLKKGKKKEGCLGCDSAEIANEAKDLEKFTNEFELIEHLEAVHKKDARDVLYNICKACGLKVHHKHSIETLAKMWIK